MASQKYIQLSILFWKKKPPFLLGLPETSYAVCVVLAADRNAIFQHTTMAPRVVRAATKQMCILQSIRCSLLLRRCCWFLATVRWGRWKPIKVLTRLQRYSLQLTRLSRIETYQKSFSYGLQIFCHIIHYCSLINNLTAFSKPTRPQYPVLPLGN